MTGGKFFFFFSFSFQRLLPVHQGGKGAQSWARQAAPCLCWTPRSRARPVHRGLGPLGGASGRTGREVRGPEGGCSLASGFLPGVLPKDLVESGSQGDLSLSPGKRPWFLWPIRLTKRLIAPCSPPYPLSLESSYLWA